MIKTTLVYLIKDGQYLMLHRIKKKEDINQGKWIGVGGKFEDGETPEQCAKREVLEETGVTVHHFDYRGIVYFENTVCESEEMHLFTSTDFSGEIRECDEGKLQWINIADLYTLNLWEGDRIFLKKLKENGPFFKLLLQYDGNRLLESRFLSEKC